MSEQRRALIALVVLTLIWGYSWVVIKQALAFAGPFSLAAHRSLVAAAVLFLVMLVSGRPLRPLAPGPLLRLGLVQTTVFLALQSWSLMAGGAGKTAVLVYTAPIWTLLLARPILGEQVRPVQWLSVLAALMGLTLIISPWRLHSGILAQFLPIAAAVTWSVATIMVKRLPTEQGRDILNLNAWQCLLGGLALLALSLSTPGRATDWSWSYLVLVSTIGVVVTAAGWMLWSYILKRLPAWQATLSILGVPAVALISSRLQTGEEIDANELAGVLLIAAGLALLSVYNGWKARRQSGA